MTVTAQTRLVQDLSYEISSVGTLSSGEIAPFWFTNNRYGLGSTADKSVLLRAGFSRNVASDSLRKWRVGYGADLVGGAGLQSHFVVQQLYADFEYKLGRLSIGQKERQAELKNPELSLGGLALGANARPLPQVRIELPDFWKIPGTKGLLGFRGHLAYGWYTDGDWQQTFNAGEVGHTYTRGSLFHSKAGFLRVGDERRFPLTLTAGLEMATQFGGTVYNAMDREGNRYDKPQHLPSGLKAYWNALSFGGNDINDGDPYANAAGNHVGSWHLRLDYTTRGWGVSAYAEHFFDDHSQLFVEYGWKDMLYGVELRLPRNPFVSTIVYEHLGMTHQSGPIYHDKTDVVPEQISGVDNYYGNHIYGSWQHAGFVMGCPLILSPLYNDMEVSPEYKTHGSLRVFHNRVTAHHIAIAGDPHRDLHYRILYTRHRSLGSYGAPISNPMAANYLLVETIYRPHKLRGLSFALAYGHNSGELLRRSNGVMLSVKFSGRLF